MIQFAFDPIFPALPPGTIEELKTDIDLGKNELYRTHWAVKSKNIFDILLRKGFINAGQLSASLDLRSQSIPEPVPQPPGTGTLNTSQVFIVHGHDEIPKLEISEFISSVGLEPIILHMQASLGKTIIEKIEEYSNVGFAVVMYTPCDIGTKLGCLQYNYRARQNVVFEHGYLIAKLGRSRVSALVKGSIEIPNDISGVIYIKFDEQGAWRDELKKEMRSAGYNVGKTGGN